MDLIFCCSVLFHKGLCRPRWAVEVMWRDGWRCCENKPRTPLSSVSSALFITLSQIYLGNQDLPESTALSWMFILCWIEINSFGYYGHKQECQVIEKTCVNLLCSVPKLRHFWYIILCSTDSSFVILTIISTSWSLLTFAIWSHTSQLGGVVTVQPLMVRPELLVFC